MIRVTPCTSGIPRVLAFLVLASSSMLLTPVSAQAQQPFRILLDDDNDTATGCTVATADGNVDGVDQLLLLTLDIQIGSAQVIGHDRQVCAAGVLVADPIVPAPPVPWNVGLGLGVDGSDVIEAFLPLNLLPSEGEVLIGIASGAGGMDPGADALLGLGPIVIEAPIFEPEIPTLGEWGMLALAALLAVLALGLLRRRRSAALGLLGLLALGSAVGLVWASVPDGLVDDWVGVTELGLDPIGEPLNEDIRAAFAEISGSQLCLRFDVFLATTNEAPDAVDDDFSVDEDTVDNALDVLANDSDPEMDPLTITGVGTPDQGGTATTDGSTIAYTPAADFKGTETFTYTIEDGNGGSDMATVTVTVSNLNDPPDAVDDAFGVNEDSVDNSLDVLANDTDAPDMGETLTITAVGMTDQGGTATTDGSTITYTPAPDFIGVETFTYTIEDGNGGSDMATVTVTVDNENDPPVAADDAFLVDEDSVDNSLDVLANDTTAPDVGETLTITAVGMTDQGGTATTDGSTITYTPAANFVGDETFTYTISDGNGGSDMATVTVTVSNTNMDPPVCVADMATTDEDNSTAVDVLANDSDPDPGQTATLTVLSVDTTGTTGLVTNNGTDVTYDPNGQFDFLDDGEMDTDSFTYTAEDDDGLTCMATVTVTITGINDVPMVVSEIFDVAAGNFEAAIGNTTLQFANTQTVTTPHRFVSGDVLDNDSDPEGDTLAITAFDATSTEGGTVTFNLATGEFSYLPPAGFEGVDSFNYTVSDGTATAMGTVSIEVADMVWYIDNDPANDGSGDDGRSSAGFDSIAQFEAENGNGAADDPEAGDIIFIFEGTSTYDAGGGDVDGIDLLDQQRLLGEGVDLVVQGLTLVSGNPANQPSIDNTNMSGDAVSVLATAGNRTGIEIRGLSIEGAGNAIEVTSTGANQVGATISDNTIAGSGTEGVDLNPGSSGAFVVLMENNVFSTASAAGTAIDLTTAAASGDVEIALNGNTDITSSGSAGIVLDNSAGGGDLFITGFAGNTVHGNTVGDGIRILNATFDADPADMNFTGDEVSGGNTTVGVGNPVGGSAMVLTNVSGDLAFGTLNLSTDGMGAVGLDVTGSGLINAALGTGFEITNTGGTISSADGPAVVLDPLTAGLTFASVSSSSSPTTGVSLVNIAGTFSAAAGSITGAAGTSFNVNGGTPAVTYNGSITHGGNASRTIEIQSMTGGSASFGGAVSATDGTGVRIANNTGTNTVSFSSTVDLGTGVGTRLTDGDAFTMTGNSAATTVSATDLDVFTNGVQGVVASGSGVLDLDALSLNTTGNGGRALNLAGIRSLVEVDTATCSNNSDCVTLSGLAASSSTTFAGVGLTCTGGTCFNASAARTVEVTGGGNTIGATNAVGLNMTDTTIGANDATFQSISASGAANGIVLDTTGTTGDFTVTGDGSLTRNDSGGVIQNTTSHGVSLNNANDVSLRSLRIDTINAAGTHGINSVGGSDVVLSAITVRNLNGTDSNGWFARDLGGVNRVDNDSLFTAFDPDAEGAIDLVNTNTNMTSFTVNDTDFTNQNENNGKSVVFIEARGTSNMGTVTVENGCVFSGLRGIALQTSAIDTGTMTSVIQGNIFRDANPGGLGGINGLAATASGSASHTITISGNDFDDVQLAGGNAGSLGVTAFNTSTLTATISNNRFIDLDTDGNVVVDAQGIRVVSEQTGGGAVNVTVSGNQLDDIGRQAIFVSTRNQAPDVDVQIVDNQIGQLAPVGFTNRDAIVASAEDDSNLDILIAGNSVTANVSSQEVLNLLTDRVSAGNTPVLNATVGGAGLLANTFTNSNGGGADNVVIETLDAGETVCINMTNNSINGVNTIDLTHSGGTLNVTQASEPAMETANGGANVIVSGAVSFGQPACATPTF